ncbi:MAG: hypothetical protein LUF33_04265 [Clostridiales bacterium]|nr:hypothetical protein [Clostridiales bacterium]
MMKVKYTGKTVSFMLTENKIYDVLAVENDWYRIKDDTDEDYLYPPEKFKIIEGSEKDLKVKANE